MTTWDVEPIETMNDTSKTAERVVLYIMVLAACAVWIGLGGVEFFGILQNAAGR